ncbi:MAG: hypothetical protein M3M96_07830 [Candidatus Eremiobacteraeota bacterium]|nr:hypothetical protein [Candidatus Eremiobacteraeota bacterium]
MKAIYKFVAGNSRLTPVGVALAAIAALLLARGEQRVAASVVFLLILILTLTASVFEKER